jgi:CDP-diacylglycerol--serine O-phosphatidyltransferase
MVSKIPTFSIKTVLVRVKPEWVLPTLIGVGLFVAALSSAPWHTLLGVGLVYVASLPIGWWEAYRLRRQYEHEQANAPPRPGEPARVIRLAGERGDDSEPS